MPQTFNCPNCGAPLDYDGSGYPTMRCPFCNNSVVVPQELRVLRDSPAAPASSPSSTPMFSVGQGGMFDLGNLLAQAGQFKELGELVRDGRKTEAVRLYRELFGVDETTATQAVEAMASSQPVVMTSSMTTFDAPSATVTTSTVQPTGVGGVGSMPRTYSYTGSGQSPARRTGVTIGVIVGCAVILIIAMSVIASLVFFLAFSGS